MKTIKNAVGLLVLWSGYNIRDSQAVKLANFPQTCEKNLERMESQPEQEKEYEKAKLISSSYQDLMFPAEQSSLYWDNHHGNDQDIINIYSEEVSGWLRPYEIIHRYSKMNTSLPLLFGTNGVQATDPGSIGALNDGWFLGAAVSLAEFPDYVTSLFTDQKYTQSGVFEIKLFLNGKWRKVIIDDRLAMLKSDLPVNAGPSQGGGWWLPLLEKAYAKMNVNYENLNSARPENFQEALRALTGMPVKELKSRRKNFVTRLKEYFMLNYALSVYSAYDTKGLKKDHSYNIVDLIEVNDELSSVGSKIVAVKLRDPWTNGQKMSYTGPDYQKYGQESKVEANKTFLMEMKDFRATFDVVYIAMIANNWIVTQQEFMKSIDDNYNMVIENNSTQNAYLTLDYPTKRMYAEGCPTDLEQVKFFISIKLLKNGTVYKARTGVDKDTSFGLIDLPNLPVGQYLVSVEMSGDLNMAPGFTVSIYSNHSSIKFKEEYYVLSRKLYEAMGRNDSKVYQSHAQDGQVQVNSYLDQYRDLSVEIVKKKQQDYKIIIQVKTAHEFPMKRTKSNTDWRNGLVVQNGTLTQANKVLKFYQMTVLCPQDHQRCIYVIPDSKILVGVIVDSDKA